MLNAFSKFFFFIFSVFNLLILLNSIHMYCLAKKIMLFNDFTSNLLSLPPYLLSCKSIFSGRIELICLMKGGFIFRSPFHLACINRNSSYFFSVGSNDRVIEFKSKPKKIRILNIFLPSRQSFFFFLKNK